MIEKPKKLKVLPKGISAVEIEVALAEFLDYRKNIIVPRVERGAGLHECDLLMLRPTGYATEFEIKISKGDLMKDLKKDHHKEINPKIKEFFYALPMNLVSTALSVLPKSVGVIGVIRKGGGELECKEIRPSEHNKAVKWETDEAYQLMRLAQMRTWKLRKDNITLLRERRK